MEQNESLTGACEPLSLFEVSVAIRADFGIHCPETQSHLAAIDPFPNRDTRLAEHVNNFRAANLIAHVFVAVLFVVFQAAV